MRGSKRAYKLGVQFQSMDQIQPRFVGPVNFRGGRNVDWSKNMSTSGESGVLKNQLIMLENYDIDEAGILVSRMGYTNKTSTAIGGGAQVHSMYRYYKTSTATAYYLVQVGAKIGTVNMTTGAFTELASGLAEVPLKWLTWNDMAYAFNGTGIYRFNGTTWVQVQSIDADCPDSTDGAVLDDVLFTARDGTTYPSRVPYSDEFDAEAWTATNYRRINERDGHTIMSLFRTGSKLACLKDLSIWFLNGSGKYDFSEEKATDKLGQVGRMASAIWEDKFFFQSGRGIEYYDQNSPKGFNCINRGTCANEIINDYSRAQREAAIICIWPKKHRLLVSYPTLSTPLIYVFFLKHPEVHEDGNIWFPHTVYTGITATAFMIADAPNDEDTLYIGTNDGKIYQYATGYADGTTAITAKMQWGYHNANNPVQVKDWTRLILPADVTGTLTAELDVDFGHKTQSKNTPSYLDTDTAIWDSAVWDTSEFASAMALTRITRFTKMKGICVAIKITGSSAGRHEIHPFQLEYYPVGLQRQI